MSLPKLSILYADGTEQTVNVRPSDVLRFEDHFKIPYVSAFVDLQMAIARAEAEGTQATFNPDAYLKVTHIWFLAYSAAKGAGSFEEWCDTLDRVALLASEEPVDDADGEVVADPLDRTATPQPSPA